MRSRTQRPSQASSLLDGVWSPDIRCLISSEEYLQISSAVLMPWNIKYYDPQQLDMMSIQDSAAAHGSKKAEKYLNENNLHFVPYNT